MDKELIFDVASTPERIEERSFEIIDSETPEPRPFAGRLWEVARRCVHALGDLEILNDLVLSEEALASGLAALKNKCRIYTDTRMLAAGLVARRMDPLGTKVVPLMSLPRLDELAREEGITRAACGVKMIANELDGQIIAVGNAPTALIALLRELEKRPEIRPALIVGMPVGFVNAAQSKEALLRRDYHYFVLRGRKGGSAVAAAALNALANMALKDANSRPST
ncbi:MAG: precorrin-8X methylmutase [Desulfovibrio sp.]|nr:precorrin-8X methylmutase [Desulfovibrio sp.]